MSSVCCTCFAAAYTLCSFLFLSWQFKTILVHIWKFLGLVVRPELVRLVTGGMDLYGARQNRAPVQSQPAGFGLGFPALQHVTHLACLLASSAFSPLFCLLLLANCVYLSFSSWQLVTTVPRRVLIATPAPQRRASVRSFISFIIARWRWCVFCSARRVMEGGSRVVGCGEDACGQCP